MEYNSNEFIRNVGENVELHSGNGAMSAQMHESYRALEEMGFSLGSKTEASREERSTVQAGLNMDDIYIEYLRRHYEKCGSLFDDDKEIEEESDVTAFLKKAGEGMQSGVLNGTISDQMHESYRALEEMGFSLETSTEEHKGFCKHK